MKRIIYISLPISLFIHSMFSFAEVKPSFDCKKASGFVEKKICEYGEYANLDNLLNKLYIEKLKTLDEGKKKALKQTQRAWLKERNQCEDRYLSEIYTCIEKSYEKRIKEVAGAKALLSHYKGLCKKDVWMCTKAAELAVEIKDFNEAKEFYKKVCDRDSDGDQGYGCFHYGAILEKLKDKQALSFYKKSCTERKNNLACAAIMRLDGSDKMGLKWKGLYRNDRGTVFIHEKKDGTITVNKDTIWANGHMCYFYGTGKVDGDTAVLNKDKDLPKCQAKLFKTKTGIIITDPKGECRAMCGARAGFEGEFSKEILKTTY